MNQPVFKLPDIDPAFSSNIPSCQAKSDKISISAANLLSEEMKSYFRENYKIAIQDKEFLEWAIGINYFNMSGLEKMEAWNLKHGEKLLLKPNGDILYDINEMYNLYLIHKNEKSDLFNNSTSTPSIDKENESKNI
jgi:hypothetical protein